MSDNAIQTDPKLKAQGLRLFHQIMLTVFIAILLPLSLSGELVFNDKPLREQLVSNANDKLAKSAKLVALQLS